MGIIRFGLLHHWPTDQAAGPEALAGLMSIHEIMMLYRLLTFPVTIAITIVGNSGICTYACASDHGQSWVLMNKVI